VKSEIIQVKLVRDIWKVFGALGVEPVFPGANGRITRSIIQRLAGDSARARSTYSTPTVISLRRFDERNENHDREVSRETIDKALMT
jgi:hypothetical protein